MGLCYSVQDKGRHADHERKAEHCGSEDIGICGRSVAIEIGDDDSTNSDENKSDGP